MSNIIRLSALFLSLGLLSGCSHPQISFDVITPGINNGVFVIKDIEGKMPYSDNIKKGHLQLGPKMIEQEGYYNLTIADDNKHDRPSTYEVYLQAGNYTIKLDTVFIGVYPQITSPSAIQKELSNYYTMVDMAREYHQFYIGANKSSKFLTIGEPERKRLEEVIHSFSNLSDPQFVEKAVLKRIITENPESLIAIHAMADMEFNNDADQFYKLYNTLSPGQRGTDDGKKLGDKLQRLARLVPGQTAPRIAGTTPDGKAFDQAALNKKIYLLEFWRAGNEVSRMNHAAADVKKMLSEIKQTGKFGMISVSLDAKREWWTGAIKDDKMDWPQYSDLKGNESANALNWGITRIPTYFLLDSNWRIIERDIAKSEVSVVVNQYLDHH